MYIVQCILHHLRDIPHIRFRSSWSPKVKCLTFLESRYATSVDFLLIQTLYLVPFAIYSAIRIYDFGL